jgi:Bacterial capsule synthesis protein PGA_cap
MTAESPEDPSRSPRNASIGEVCKVSFWFFASALVLALIVSAAGQQIPRSTPSPAPVIAQAVPLPSPTPLGTPGAAAQTEQEPQQLPAPNPSPTPSTAPEPGRSGPGFVFPDLNDREIVVTAVGDVMLGTTFPDESGLPPNDGADLLKEVTPILKRGDIVFGNLEGPLVDGDGTSLKCRGKASGHCYAFRVPTRYGAHLKAAGFNVMGLANNHAMDFGEEGRTSSRQTL